MQHRCSTSGPRLWEITDAMPFREIPDCSRGDLRLAAEVALSELAGRLVSETAHYRALNTLTTMAKS